MINGRAPLDDRFVLGNTYYLRGWNKYEIDPLGGNRVVSNSVEYRYGPFSGILRYRRHLGRGPAGHREALGRGGAPRLRVLSGGGFSSAVRARRTDIHDGHSSLMAEPSRGLQISRRCWLLAGLAAPLFRARGAETLTVTFDGDNLHVSSPDLHFLTGKPLERLKDGTATVQYLAHCSRCSRTNTSRRHSSTPRPISW